jgi:hypothetical protein
MPDTLAPLGLDVDTVSGSTVAMVVVVVGTGAVVVAAVVAGVLVVTILAELPQPDIPNAAANRSTENARKRDTRLPFEVPAQPDWLAAD